MELSSKEIRYLLQNAGKIKRDGKCIPCGGTGWVNWNSKTGNDVKPGRRIITTNRDEDECEKCQGVGYRW